MSACYEQRWKKKIYRALKKGIFEFARINNPVYGWKKDCVVTTDEQGRWKFFNTIQQSLTTRPVMTFFDTHRTIKLIVDRSKKTVLGSILKQYHPAKSDTKLSVRQLPNHAIRATQQTHYLNLKVIFIFIYTLMLLILITLETPTLQLRWLSYVILLRKHK